MIGILNITTIFIYLSFSSATIGIISCFNGRPKLAVICLLISGFANLIQKRFSNFDNNEEKEFITSIDLYDNIVSFCILPITIGMSLLMRELVFVPVYIIFALASLIRLGYYRQKINGKYTIGTPIKITSLLIPFLYLLRGVNGFIYLYPFALLVLSFTYVTKIKIKFTLKNSSYILFGLGLLELILVIFR